MDTIKKTSSSITRTASKTKIIVLLCVVFVILCGVAYVSFYQFFLEKHFQQMIDDGVVAKAEITGCSTRGEKMSYFVCVYKYVDENGTKYTGTLYPPIYPYFRTSKEAEEHIGEAVEIYIDGKGKSIPVGAQPEPGRAIFWVVFSTVLVCADIAGIVIVSMKIHKNKSSQKLSKS